MTTPGVGNSGGAAALCPVRCIGLGVGGGVYSRLPTSRSHPVLPWYLAGRLWSAPRGLLLHSSYRYNDRVYTSRVRWRSTLDDGRDESHKAQRFHIS